MASNYGQKKPDSYDAKVAGAKRYGPAATGRGPNVGPVSASGKAGYAERDQKLRSNVGGAKNISANVRKANPFGNPNAGRNVQAEAKRNALLRRLQAEQKGAYADRDALLPKPTPGGTRVGINPPQGPTRDTPLKWDRSNPGGRTGAYGRNTMPIRGTNPGMSRGYEPPRRRRETF